MELAKSIHEYPYHFMFGIAVASYAFGNLLGYVQGMKRGADIVRELYTKENVR